MITISADIVERRQVITSSVVTAELFIHSAGEDLTILLYVLQIHECLPKAHSILPVIS